MAISDRIRAEAERTIERMQRHYKKYSDDVDDAEELEHRIARIEASLEGCNGFTQEEKIQKTAENVFELTCAQERTYDALRMEIKITRDEYKKEFLDLNDELKNGLKSVMKKIEDSGMDESAKNRKFVHMKCLSKLIADNPMLAFGTFMFVLLLVFVSGRFELISGLFKATGNG